MLAQVVRFKSGLSDEEISETYAFRESDLARTIPEAYRVQGAPDVQVAEVVMVLHPHSA
jgi:hypothetical protein